MISTQLITNLWSVPREWIFEYYLNLMSKLTGESVKIKSVFNPKDRTPSMVIYFDEKSNQYKFKDFSAGYQGDAIRLVELLYNLNRDAAKLKIRLDYEGFCKNYTPNKDLFVTAPGKYKLTDYEIRHWNTFDRNFWTSYHIGSAILNQYNIAALKYYTLTRDNADDTKDRITIEKENLYGYFTDDGTLYKIYQPKVLAKKFLKVGNYIQGSEQLTYTSKYLLITASMKDLLSFKMLGIGNIEVIAPDAESTILPEDQITFLKSKYSKIFVAFDNDDTGKLYMQKYRDDYGIIPLYIDLDKDIADCVKNHGIDKVREVLFPLLKQVL